MVPMFHYATAGVLPIFTAGLMLLFYNAYSFYRILKMNSTLCNARLNFHYYREHLTFFYRRHYSLPVCSLFELSCIEHIIHIMQRAFEFPLLPRAS